MYNKSEIMKNAWTKFNANKGRKFPKSVKVEGTIYTKTVYVEYTFSMALTTAWAVAKMEARNAAAQKDMTTEERISKLESCIFQLSMNDRFSNSDFAQMAAWRNELAQLKAVA